MKKLYWRPREVSKVLLILMAIVAVGGVVVVESFKVKTIQPYQQEKLAAAQLTAKAFRVLRQERLRRGIPLTESDFDPARSGIIGPRLSPVTTVPGALLAKQTSVNPNFAAVLVHYFKRLGLKHGDLVAVGYSGSFPALNVAVLAAVHTLRLRPVSIASVGASGFGANMGKFLWIDMERTLNVRGIFRHRSVAASLGGIGDNAIGMRRTGKRRIHASIKRNGLTLIQAKSFTDGVNQRMKLYKDHAGDLPYRAYINVGGGTLSVGTSVGKQLYKPGLNRRPPPGSLAVDSVMTRFMKQDIPLIHLVNITTIAKRYKLPESPRSTPKPGEGGIFSRQEYNRWLVVGVLLLILGTLTFFIRSEVGQRIMMSAGVGDKKPPEPSI